MSIHTAYDEGLPYQRSFDDLEELTFRGEAVRPRVRYSHSGSGFRVELCGAWADAESESRCRGYRWRNGRGVHHVDIADLDAELRWALDVGFRIGSDGCSRLDLPDRQLAWDPLEFRSGEGLDRALCEEGQRRIKRALGDSLERGSQEAHFVPTVDGGLEGLEGTDNGWGVVAWRRTYSVLNVFLPRRDRLSWLVQRLLVEAAVDDRFGEGTRVFPVESPYDLEAQERRS